MTPDLPDQRVIFLHIPKTGGSTLRASLRRQFPPSATYTPSIPPDPGVRYRRYLEGEGAVGESADTNDAGLRDLEQLDNQAVDAFRLFLGHFWFGVHDRLPAPRAYVTFVRDPIDRLLSLHRHRVIHHGLRQTTEDWVCLGRELELDNAQTRRIAGSSREHRLGPCTQTMFDNAGEHLVTRFAAVGVTERYEHSLVALARAFGWPTMRYQWLNRSDGRDEATTLPPDVIEILEEHNRYDRALHRIAGEGLDRALAGVDTDREVGILRRANHVSVARRRVRVVAHRVKRAGLRLRGSHR